MESSDEVEVCDIVRLMQAYVEHRIDAGQYTRWYFDLMVKRVNIPCEEVNRITQQAYGDADDYEPDPKLRLKLTNTIGESELRGRVAKSLRELEGLGYREGGAAFGG